MIILHNDYKSQVLYLLSDRYRESKNVGTFGDYAFIAHLGTVLEPKDAKVTQTGNRRAQRIIVAMNLLKLQLEAKGLEAVPKVGSFFPSSRACAVCLFHQVNIKGKMR